MDDEIGRLRSYLSSGDCCAVALLHMGLDLRGLEDGPALQAASALCGGVRAGLLCGALTGAALMMGVIAPRSAADGSVRELSEWFVGRAEEEWGGSDCARILEGDVSRGAAVCPALVEEVYQKAREILRRRGLAE